MNTNTRKSERRSERLLGDLLASQGWDLRKPPQGDQYIQNEYRDDPALSRALEGTSKTGSGPGIPEAILVDGSLPLLVIETKARPDAISEAMEDAERYAGALIQHGYQPLAVGLAGTEADDFALRVSKWTNERWVPITYDEHPINWIPGKTDVLRLVFPDAAAEIRPTPPPDYVLADKADEINRLLREADIKDEYRPTHVAAVMLALWHSKGNIRRQPQYILRDINAECRDALIQGGQANLATNDGIGSLARLNATQGGLSNGFLRPVGPPQNRRGEGYSGRGNGSVIALSISRRN